MTKQEFLETLRRALNGNMASASVEDNIRFYESYFASEMAKGRSEADILQELGDARILARTLIDAAERAGDEYAREANETQYGQARNSYNGTQNGYGGAGSAWGGYGGTGNGYGAQNGGTRSAYGNGRNVYGNSRNAYGNSRSGYGGRGAYDGASYTEEDRTGADRLRMPGWLIALIVIVVLVAVISMVGSLVWTILPYLIPILLVVWLIRLFRGR